MTIDGGSPEKVEREMRYGYCADCHQLFRSQWEDVGGDYAYDGHYIDHQWTEVSPCCGAEVLDSPPEESECRVNLYGKKVGPYHPDYEYLPSPAQLRRYGDQSSGPDKN